MLNTLRRLFSPPVFEDEGDNFTARNLNVILLSVFASILVTMLRYLALGKFWQGNAGPVFLMTGAIVGGVYILFQKRYIRVGSVLAVSIFTLMPFALILMSGNGIHDTATMLLPVVVFIASLLLSSQGLVAHVFLIALGYGVIVRMEVNKNLITSFSSLTTNSDFTDALTILSMAAVMSGLMSISLRKNLKQLSDALRGREISEERYRLLSNLSTDYIFSSTVHKNGNITHDWESGAFESVSGYTPEEFRARGGWRATVHPDDLDIDERLLEKLRRNEKTVGELRVITKNGGTRWIREYIHPVWDEQENRLAGIYGAVQNIDEQKLAEQTLRNRAEEISLLYQITLALAQGQNLYDALRAFVKELKRVMIVDAFHVGLYDEQTDLFSYTLFLNLEEDLQLPPRKLRESPGLTWEVISKRRTLYLPDISDPQTRQAHNIVVIQDADIHSYIGIPLILQEKVVGVMSVQSLQQSAYTVEQIQLLEATAAQVVITIEKLRLLEELRQELAERKRAEDTLRQRDAILQAVTHAAQVLLQSSDWRESINQVLDELGKATRASHVYIFENHILDSGMEVTSQKYEWAAPSVVPDIDNPKYQNMPLFEEGVGDWVKILQSGRSYAGNIHTLPEKSSAKIQERGIKSILDVPIFVSEKWWGEIGFDDMEDVRDWDSSEVEILEVAARMIGAAIEREKVNEVFRQNEERYRSELEHQVVERTSQLTAANDLLKDEKTKIEQVVNEVATLRKLSDFLQSSMTIEEASGVIAGHMKTLFTNTNGGLYLISDGFTDLTLTSSWGDFKTESIIQPNDCWGMRRGRTFVRHPFDASPICAHFGESIPDESLCLPLMGQNEIIGMLCLQISKSKDTYFTQDVQNLAVASADSIALALANLRLRERLRNQTIRDPLTGIFNRRFMEETLEREIHRAGRNREPLCVIMFEIDDFKVYNNTFGHDAGDYALKKVTDTMRSKLRRSDFPCRYGGDEFTLLLPNTTLEDGAYRAEELRKEVAALALSFNNQALGQVTVRMGVAVYPKHGETGEAVLKVADDACYRARAIGKNCVVVAE